ncbi:MAG: GDP-mannose 4,6-dehydratase [Thermoleophilia bacterium]
MRVLVTGVSGFVGNHLAPALLRDGATVAGLVEGAGERVPAGAEVLAGDVTDAGAVARAVTAFRPEAVVHLAGASSVGASLADPLPGWHVNAIGTMNVLEAVRLHAPEAVVLCVASAEIHGRVPLDALPVTPETPLRPLSPYGASKAAADLAAAQYHDGFGVRAVRVRSFNHIGPGQGEGFVVPRVAMQIATAEAAGAARVALRMGNLDTRRDFTDVRDVAEAYRVLLHQGVPDRPYVVCSGRSVAIRELVDRLAALTDLPVDVDTDPALMRAGEQADLFGDASALAELGWTPRIPLDRTLADTLDWCRSRAAAQKE